MTKDKLLADLNVILGWADFFAKFTPWKKEENLAVTAIKVVIADEGLLEKLWQDVKVALFPPKP